MHEIPISDVVVGERFRKEFGDLDDLASSIERVGLIHPIVVTDENDLIAGERRLRACMQLGMESIPVVYREDVDEHLLRELELEENIARKDMTWQERVVVLGNPDMQGVDAEKGWGQAETATAIDRSVSAVSRDLSLARTLKVLPHIAEIKTAKDAEKEVVRQIDAIERELKARKIQKEVKGNEDGVWNQVLHGDSLNELLRIPDGSIDCVIADVPYGTEIHKDSARGVHFDDSKREALEFMRGLAHELKRVCRPDAHVYIFFGIKLWTATMDVWYEAGWNVDPIPIVWHKNLVGMVDVEYRYGPCWEPILFCKQEQPRRLNGFARNLIEVNCVPGQERVNHVQKPTALLKELILNSTQEGDRVLDPCCGSGSTLVTAKRLGRNFIGIEMDGDQVNAARIWLDEEERDKEVEIRQQENYDEERIDTLDKTGVTGDHLD